MIHRRTFSFAAIGVALFVTPLISTAWAVAEEPFSNDAFKAAQDAGRPVLVRVHATWCSTCKAQDPVLSELAAQPKFKDLAIFRVDFDNQKEAVKQFKAQMQSTLIVFKGTKEVGRSVGDTRRPSIASLLDKAL